jgi:TonB-linked SusC/RagA family outer membrane protein
MKTNLILKACSLLVLLLFMHMNAWAQERTVTGTVTAEAGEPLIGATVVVQGTTIGSVTGVDGSYSIQVPADGETIVFSFIGMETQEIPIGDQTIINVVLQEEIVGLDEIVVVGYSAQRKINLTGSVSSIESDELVKVPSANVSEILTGKAPGLITQQSQGVPGNDFTTISIRGYDAPLVLVDGIEMDWTRLDPNEIESVSILKDASAAIYGSRAGNGVILITTKRGTLDKPTITYTGNVTFQEPTTLPDFVDSWQYAELLHEGEFNQALTYTYTEEEIQIFKDGDNPDYPNTDWHEEMFRHWAPMHNHNLSVRGGSEQVKYYMSTGYLAQGSLYESGDLNFNRYNARSNIDAQITKSLNVSLDLAYRKELRDQPQTGLGDNWADLHLARPDYSAHIPDPELGAAYAGFNVRSPLAQTYQKYTGFIDDRREYITGKINLNFKMPGIEGLEANAKLNYLLKNTYKKTQDKPFEVLEYNYQAGTYSSYGFNGQNTLDEESNKYTQLYPIISLNYDRNFGDHSVTGLLLAEWIDVENVYYTAGKIDLLSMELPYLFAGAPENITADGYTTESGRASYAGRLNYNYKGKYLLEGTFRFDATSKFPEDSRWGFFPSVSAGWRISDESFMENLSWLDNLKLRVSYSKSGLDDVAAFKYITGYTIRTGLDPVHGNELFLFGDNVYRMITSTGLPNEDITWLDMTTYNVGLDGTFMRGLFGFEVDLFYRITDNIFGEPLATYPSTFGAILPQLNLNSTDDRGFEIMLTHRNRISNDFFYSLEGQFSIAREKYRDWSEPPYDDEDEIRIYQLEGNYTNRRIGYLSDGIFMTQDEIDNHPINQDEADNVTLRPGDIIYKDLNNDGLINWRDQDEIGYGTFPDVVYSLNFTLGYKGLSVTALFQGASMFDHYNEIFPLVNFGPPWDFHYKYRWQPDPNDPTTNINPDAQLPAILGDGVGRSPNNEKNSDFWVQNATYLRLKNLNISYTIPKKWIQVTGIQDLRVTLSGSNLVTISGMGIYKHSIDPESIGTGGSRLYPPVRTISLGLNIVI